MNVNKLQSVYLEDDIKPGKPTNLNQLAALELQATGRFSFHDNGKNIKYMLGYLMCKRKVLKCGIQVNLTNFIIFFLVVGSLMIIQDIYNDRVFTIHSYILLNDFKKYSNTNPY